MINCAGKYVKNEEKFIFSHYVHFCLPKENEPKEIAWSRS